MLDRHGSDIGFFSLLTVVLQLGFGKFQNPASPLCCDKVDTEKSDNAKQGPNQKASFCWNVFSVCWLMFVNKLSCMHCAFLFV